MAKRNGALTLESIESWFECRTRIAIFATMLVPLFHPAADWAESLAESLLHPQLPISLLEALGRRLRRNYAWIYIILGVAWMSKIWLHPTPTGSWEESVSRAAIGDVQGELIFGISLAVNGALMLLALLTAGLQQASGEVLLWYGGFQLGVLTQQDPGASRRVSGLRAWFRPSRRREQLLAWVITDRARAVVDRILQEMKRG
jgi:hypothetical protein